MARKIRRLDFPRYRPAQFAASTNRIRIVFFLEEKKKKKKKEARVKNRGESCVRSFFGIYGRSFLRWFFVIEREREREIWSEIKVDLLGLIFGISDRRFCWQFFVIKYFITLLNHRSAKSIGISMRKFIS